MTVPLNYKSRMRPIALAAIILTLAFSTADYVRPAPRTIEVAKGIYLFVTQPYGDAGLDGNSVAIISNDGVLVFDTNGTPAASAAVLAEIRKLTDKPVQLRRQLALALGSLVRHRDLHQGLPGREGHRSREDARDDGRPGDRVQPSGRRTQLPGYVA